MIENSPIRPNSEKGEVRARILQQVFNAIQNNHLRAAVARAADFYGPECHTSVLNATVFERMAQGKSAFLMGRADKVHTYTYTPDIGKALAILGTDDRANGTAHEGTGHGTAGTGHEGGIFAGIGVGGESGEGHAGGSDNGLVHLEGPFEFLFHLHHIDAGQTPPSSDGSYTSSEN